MIHRRAHEEHLEYFRSILPEVDQVGPFMAHTLKFGIRYYEMVLEWLAEMPVGAEPASTEA